MDDRSDAGLDLHARTIALELVVQRLFALWASEREEPRRLAFGIMEGVIRSVEAGEPADDEARKLSERIAHHLRDFASTIDGSLARRDEL